MGIWQSFARMRPDQAAQHAQRVLGVTLGLIAFLRGWNVLLGEGPVWLTERLTAQGLPGAASWALAYGWLQLLAGLALVVGWRLRQATLVLAGFCVAWGILFQRDNGWFDLGSDRYGVECTVLMTVALLGLHLYQDLRYQRHAVLLLRYFTAFFVCLHGWHRIENGGWVGWGQYLSAQGWPMGVAITGGITTLEALGAPVFAWARWPRISLFLGIVFCVLYSFATAMHHWRFGWFLKPEGVNGVEASVLLLACFVSVILALPKAGAQDRG